MRSVSNQNCCKGFRFTEKVEKHWRIFIPIRFEKTEPWAFLKTVAPRSSSRRRRRRRKKNKIIAICDPKVTFENPRKPIAIVAIFRQLPRAQRWEMETPST